MRAKLKYRNGTLSIEGDVTVPQAEWDERTGSGRALAFRYRDIKTYLEGSGISCVDRVLDPIPCPELSCAADLRPCSGQSWKVSITSSLLKSVNLPLKRKVKQRLQ